LTIFNAVKSTLSVMPKADDEFAQFGDGPSEAEIKEEKDELNGRTDSDVDDPIEAMDRYENDEDQCSNEFDFEADPLAKGQPSPEQVEDETCGELTEDDLDFDEDGLAAMFANLPESEGNELE
jgi:hypothetical protein